MTRNQEEQLDELADHIAQAKTILTDLAESIETVGSDENPDDEVEDTGEASDEIDAMLNTLDELESSLDDLREAIQGLAWAVRFPQTEIFEYVIERRSPDPAGRKRREGSSPPALHGKRVRDERAC